MIRFNNSIISQNSFPDGTLRILDFPVDDITSENKIIWKYENDAELFTLICLVKHVKNNFPDTEVSLYMYFVPHSRMDRVKADTEVFTLKYFAEVINSLGFKKVFVLDPHSNVTTGLIDHVVNLSPEMFIGMAIEDIDGLPYVYFPDEGAYKRYGDLDTFKGMSVLIGHKVRDWSTGKIQGLKITDRNGMGYSEGYFDGESVLMIDDIISYGGTMAYSADELKKLGFDHVYAYATHTENSIQDPEKSMFKDRLDRGVIDKLYTTDSLYTYGGTDRIMVYIA